MAIISVNIEVEDVALGPVMIALRKMQGVIKFDVDLERFAPGSGTPANRAIDGVSYQDMITAAMLKAHPNTVTAKELRETLKLNKMTVYGALNSLSQRGIAVRGTEPRTWHLSKKAAAELGAIKLLPKPRAEASQANGHAPTRQAKGASWPKLHSLLSSGPVRLTEIAEHFAAVDHLSTKAVHSMMKRAQVKKLAKSNGKGMWELTAKGLAARTPINTQQQAGA